MKKTIITSFSIVLIGFLFTSCNEKKKLPIAVNNLQHICVHRLTDIIVYDIFTPPVAGRIYAYANLAFYEALRWKQEGSSSITARLKGFAEMPQPEKNKKYDFSLAAVRSFFTVAKALTFSKDSLIKTENDILKEFEKSTGEEVYQNSTAFGDSIAIVILKRAADDNYKKTRGMAKYSVFKEAGKWQQTPPDYADAVEPNWHLIKTLLLDSAAQCRPVNPPLYNLDKNSKYYKELMDLYTASKALTPAQDTIAHFWDDNPFVTEHKGHLMFATKKITPVGHWMGIVAIVCRQTKCDEVKTAKVYALTSCSIFDAFISCWEEKYKSKMVRPITVIRENIDPEWNSLLQTPPFPEYPSGHSVITAAAATVLTHLLGSTVAFNDTSELEYIGIKRHFNSIKEAADEAAISRFYGGIHYRSAIEEGKKEGVQVGNIYNSIFK